MRITSLVLCLLLIACAAPGQPYAVAPAAGSVEAAQSYCMQTRNLRPGTYNYDTCYNNRPEVQAYERGNRLSNAAIILKNRSVYSSYRGRSYPVE